MYSVMYRNSENSDEDNAKAAIAAPPNVGTRNSARSNIGYSTRLSTTMNATSSATAPTRNATISGLPQPSGLPRTSAKISRKSPSEKVTSPGQSVGPAFG